jgi:hypothetical protein
MEVEAVTKARALAMLELDALTNGGKIRLADCIGPIVTEWGFQQFPSKPEDFDLDKGVRFESGMANGLLIDSLVIYGGAIVIDTLASTDDSKRLIVSLLEWARDKFGASYEERLIRRWGHISDIVFRSDIPLIRVYSSPLVELARKTSAITEEVFDGLEYEPSQIWIGHDPLLRNSAIASFIIQHRANTPFKDNIFFSEAPLPTHQHIQFLREFEKDVRASLR